MRILGDRWTDGYVDYSRHGEQCRIKVRLWKALIPIPGLYFVPRKDWRLVVNYVREVGLRQVLRKVRSRWHEALRNAKYFSCGIGEILECGESSSLHIGQAVVFLAPCHPQCVERIVLPPVFIKPLGQTGLLSQFPPSDLLYSGCEDDQGSPVYAPWLDLAGWSEFSGSEVNAQKLQQVLPQVEEYLSGLILSQCTRLSIRDLLPIREMNGAGRPAPQARLQAVLFGYGHYAKATILPNLPPSIAVRKVHEIDPCQIGPVGSLPFVCDSAAFPRPSEEFDIYFIAGFHHTHCDLAVHALQSNAFAVVEKPIVTDFAQLEKLLAAVAQTPRKFFSCFHKRYSSINKFVRTDLGIAPGEPISYHCIVYEAKLPALHWYRWPNSGSRIISNGCHWIDHFLFLNNFMPVSQYDIWETSNGDVAACAELSNGASFHMILTDHGSSRIGVQDYVELRAKDTTVRIQNGSSYMAENARRVIRRRRMNKMSSYNAMYREIAKRMAAGTPGDTLESVERSSRLVLLLEEKLRKHRRGLLT